jgi:hypothetical protein
MISSDAVREAIPFCQSYPTSGRNLNQESWQLTAYTWFGGEDDLSGRLWWEVN